MKVRILKHGKNHRRISKKIENELMESLGRIKTPFWSIDNSRIKRAPYDVPQAWLNNILSKRLAEIDYASEINPFTKTRPNSIMPRSRNSKNNRQAIDFERIIDGKRHVIEVECGNVASLYRSIHKICMAMKEDKNAVGIVIVPSRKLMGRCEPPSAMSTSTSAPIILSEFAYYAPLADDITIIEFCTSTLIDIYSINPNPKFWKGNWSKSKNDFLNNNLELFLK